MTKPRNLIDNDDVAKFIQYVFDVTGKDPKDKNNAKIYYKLLEARYENNKPEALRKKFGEIVNNTKRSKKEYTFVRNFDIYGKGLSEKMKNEIVKINNSMPISPEETIANYQKNVINKIYDKFYDTEGTLEERLENFDKYLSDNPKELYEYWNVAGLDLLADLLLDIAKNASNDKVIIDENIRKKVIHYYKKLKGNSSYFKIMHSDLLDTNVGRLIDNISKKIEKIRDIIDIDKNEELDTEINLPKENYFDSDRDILNKIHIPFTKENLPKIKNEIERLLSVRNVDDNTLHLISKDIIHIIKHVDERTQNTNTLERQLKELIEKRIKRENEIRKHGNLPFFHLPIEDYYDFDKHHTYSPGLLNKNVFEDMNIEYNNNTKNKYLNPLLLESVYKEIATHHNEHIRDFANIGFDTEKNIIKGIGKLSDKAFDDIIQKASNQALLEDKKLDEISENAVKDAVNKAIETIDKKELNELSKNTIDSIVDNSIEEIREKEDNYNEMTDLNVRTLTDMPKSGFAESAQRLLTNTEQNILNRPEQEKPFDRFPYPEEEEYEEPLEIPQALVDNTPQAVADNTPQALANTETSLQPVDKNDPGQQMLILDGLTKSIDSLKTALTAKDTNDTLGTIVSLFKQLPNIGDDEIANRLSEAVGPDGKKLFESKEEAMRFISKMRALNGNRVSSIKGDKKGAIRLNISNNVISNIPKKPFIVDMHPIPYQY